MRYLKELLNKIWLVVILTVVVAAVMFSYSAFFATPMYSSDAKMFVNNRTDTSTGTVSSSDITARAALVKTYAEIIKSKNLMQKVVDKIDEFKDQPGYSYLQDSKYSAEYLAKKVNVESANETEVFIITIDTPDPYESQFIVAAITEYLPDTIKNIVEASSVALVDSADLNTSPTSPNVFRNTVLGAAIGLIVAALAVFLMLLTDTVVRSEEDLTEAFGEVIVLGTIPLMHLDADKLPTNNGTNNNTAAATKPTQRPAG